jgi:hypothetical protein
LLIDSSSENIGPILYQKPRLSQSPCASQDAGINLRPQAGAIEMDKYGSAPKILIQASQVK